MTILRRVRIKDERVTTIGRHSRVHVSAEEARTLVGVTRTPGRGANHRERRPRRGGSRRTWLLVAGGVALAALAVLTVPPGAQPRDTSPPGPTALTPNGPTGDWRLIFSDEFDGTTLDTTRWLPCVSHGQLGYPTTCTGWKDELQTYHRENLEVRDGALRMVATRDAERYTSGAITTARDTFGYGQSGYSEFTYTYGYAEVRFRAPPGPGMWPAVWALPYNTDGAEIDIVEIVKDNAYLTLHTASAETGGQFEFTGTDFTQGWHTVGTEWEPGRLTWYVDGEQVYTVTSGVPDRPVFIQANLAIGGGWPGPPTSATRFPTSLDIDYVRVFQHRP